MSQKIRKENFINSLYPYKFKCNKTLIINFLSEIYANYYNRCNKIFDEYSFQELMQIPMIVSNKLYSTFTSYKKYKLSVDKFSSNIYTLFFGDMNDKMSMMFDIFDFDGDGSIIYEDVFLILSHMHLINYTLETIESLENLISNFFANKTKVNKDNFFNLNENYDILLLLLIYLCKYQSLITEEDLTFYKITTSGWKNRSKTGSDITNNLVSSFSFTLQTYTIYDYEELEYKPSNLLLEYLDNVEFYKKTKKKIIEEEEEDDEEFFENEDKDLNALCDFVMDFRELRERFINQCNLEPKLFTSTFIGSMFQEERDKKKEIIDYDIDRQVNIIMKNQLYKNIIKDKIYQKKKVLLQKNHTVESYSPEKTTELNSSLADLDNVGFIKKTYSIMNQSMFNLSFMKKFNPKYQNRQEIILYKDNNKSRKKKVKLILFNHYIFYYVTFNQFNFLYKKIIPIINLYVHKKKVDNIIYLKFVSQAHNKKIQKIYYCDNIELANKFCSRFNNANYQRDITKSYYFKYEIDKGKFGHVFLARRNKDNKKFAIKLVQKNNCSLEEYKICRWEINIFNLLKNINHQNIVKCNDIYENESQIFFIYEYLSCGNLKKYMQELKFSPSSYNTDTILKLSMQLIEGLHILHKFGIVHRDIKTTNIMIEINSPIKKSIISNSFGTNDIQITYEDMSDITLKIIDFGLSQVLGVNETSEDPYGSLSFKAPELILHKKYNFKVDVWAMGVSLYYIVYKMLPFDEGNREEIKKAIVNNPVIFYENEFLYDTFYYKNYMSIIDKDSKEIKASIIYSILKDCLVKDPDERFSIDELYNKYYDLIKNI